MCSKQKIRKTALILLLATLISLIPSKTFSVLADDIIPPFPYDELQTIGENDYALFKVHGVEQVDYIEVLMPKIQAHGNFEHLMPGLSYSSLGGWVLQINSIDYYFKDGQSIYFDLQSLFTTSFMPVENDDDYFPAWLELVYTSEDIWGIDEDAYNDRGLRFFKAQNFIIEPATPTPTPVPDDEEPELDTRFPNFINAYRDNYLNNSNRAITNLLISIRYYDETNTRYEFRNYFIWDKYNPNVYGNSPIYIPNYNGYDYISPTFTCYLPNIATRDSYGIYSDFYLHFDNLDNATNDYDCTNVTSAYPGYRLNNPGGGREYTLTSQDNGMNYESAAIFQINSDGTCTRLDGQGGGTATPTPTPTSAPTPIPQPSVTPEADNDKPGWGWGIVNTLRYIFIPDKNKLIRLQKTADTKFKQFGGGYDDLKRVSGFEDPVRPQNVVMNWTPFSTDSDEQQPQQQITLVDFEQIDFYLFQTPSGMFIKDCLSASFTFLMFGYLIHVIRKHFVIENTDDDEKGGGD